MNREYLVSVFFIPSLPCKALRTLVELGIRYSIYQFTHCFTFQTGDYNITIFLRCFNIIDVIQKVQ